MRTDPGDRSFARASGLPTAESRSTSPTPAPNPHRSPGDASDESYRHLFEQNCADPRALEPTHLITASSTTQVDGTTIDLTGATLTPWFQLAGQAAYTQGKITVTVASDGTFTWSHETAKRIKVHFTHGDVKSNTITIAAR